MRPRQESLISRLYKDLICGWLGCPLFNIYKSGCYDIFALGYRVGETNAGELYLLIKFDENLKSDKDIVYEIY